MFAHQIRPTEVSLVLYIVEEIARDADFRAANAEKLMELAESRLARYSHHDPGNRAKAWSAWPPERNGCSTACSKRKGVLYRTSLRGTAGEERDHMKTILRRSIATLLAAAMLVAVAGCAGQPLSTREKGTLIGGVGGAGAGALIGSMVGHPGAGAAIGGIGGAAAGYGIGNNMQNEQNERYRRYGE
jgi:hypothetical protein